MQWMTMQDGGEGGKLGGRGGGEGVGGGGDGAKASQQPAVAK